MDPTDLSRPRSTSRSAFTPITRGLPAHRSHRGRPGPRRRDRRQAFWKRRAAGHRKMPADGSAAAVGSTQHSRPRAARKYRPGEALLRRPHAEIHAAEQEREQRPILAALDLRDANLCCSVATVGYRSCRGPGSETLVGTRLARANGRSERVSKSIWEHNGTSATGSTPACARSMAPPAGPRRRPHLGRPAPPQSRAPRRMGQSDPPDRRPRSAHAGRAACLRQSGSAPMRSRRKPSTRNCSLSNCESGPPPPR
jgi:hypothetical protein